MAKMRFLGFDTGSAVDLSVSQGAISRQRSVATWGQSTAARAGVGLNMHAPWYSNTPWWIDRGRNGEWNDQSFIDNSASGLGRITDNGSTTRTFAFNHTDTSFVTALDTSYRGGTFRLTWTGGSGVTVSNAGGMSNISGSGNTRTFTLDGNAFGQVQFDNISYADPPRDIKIIRTDMIAAYDAGDIVDPEYKAAYNWVSRFRTTWPQYINEDRDGGGVGVGNQIVNWSDNRTEAHQQWKEVPPSALIKFANEMGTDLHIHIPHQASDAWIAEMALLVRDLLAAGLVCYVEWTNEVFNGAYQQYPHSVSQGGTQWPSSGFSDFEVALSYQGYRTKQIKDIFVSNGVPESKYKIVLTTQMWAYAARQVLDAPVWQSEDPGTYVAPHTIADILMGANYIGGGVFEDNALATEAMNRLATSQQDALDYMIEQIWANKAEPEYQRMGVMSEAFSRGLPYGTYEGGVNHINLITLTGTAFYSGGQPAAGVPELFTALAYSSEMAEIADADRECTRNYPLGTGDVNQITSDAEPATVFGIWGSRRVRTHTNALDTAAQTWAGAHALPYVMRHTGWPIDFDSVCGSIGHSLNNSVTEAVDYFMTDHFNGSGIMRTHGQGGSLLSNNWVNHTGAETGNNYAKDLRALMEGTSPHDALLATERVHSFHSYIANTGSGDPINTAGADIRAWGLWHNLGASQGMTRFFVYETWADRTTGTAGNGGIDPSDPLRDTLWNPRITAEWQSWVDIKDYLETGDHSSLNFTDTITGGTEIYIVPGGQVLQAVDDALTNGDKPAEVTYTSVDDLFSDDIHLNGDGHFAIACAWYMCFFQRSVIGLPQSVSNYWDNGLISNVADDNRMWLQGIVDRVVRRTSHTGWS